MALHHQSTTVPPTPRSRFSTLSTSSRTNLVAPDENGPQTGLPSYWSPFSKHPESPRMKDRLAGIFQGWRIIVLGSWLNLLLVMLPISWTLSFVMENSHGLVFIFSIITLIPLVKLHDLATHELALRIGGARTGLLGATLSNVVSLVVAISALRQCELRIVQASLIGSMLGKLLLVLGLCFFAGGVRFSEQGFDATATQVHSSLLSISVGALFLPVVYHFSLSGTADTTEVKSILSMSRGVSIILLFIYVAYMVFQLWSHTHLYHDRHNKKSPSFSSKESKKLPESQRTSIDSNCRPPAELSTQITESQEATAAVTPQPQLSWTLTILLLVLVTVAASVTADTLVESMNGISDTVRKEWVALILLPAVTSLAECMTAVNVSIKDQLTLSISVAVGSALQTALLLIPFMVTLAWTMGKPLSLLTDPFEALVLYIAVQTMSYVVVDGKSNWLEGLILICLYVIIAVSFWFYPGSNLPSSLIHTCPTAG